MQPGTRGGCGCQGRRDARTTHRATIEQLEPRTVLSALLGAATAGQSQTLADLPFTQQASISAAIGCEQATNHVAASPQRSTLADPESNFNSSLPSGVMQQTAELTAADGAANDDLGNSVAISGNTVVVGAQDATIGGNVDQGAVYVFVQSGSTWIQQAKLTTAVGAAHDRLGCAVAVSGNTLVTAGAGGAYVFVRSGSVWTQSAELTPSNGGANSGFGYSVAISGNTVVVGRRRDCWQPKSRCGVYLRGACLRLD